jgi:hypothetical protein
MLRFINAVFVWALTVYDRYYAHGESAMGTYRNVFSWLSKYVLGGSRTPAQVKYFLEHSVLSSAILYGELLAARGSSDVCRGKSGGDSGEAGSDMSGSDDEGDGVGTDDDL